MRGPRENLHCWERAQWVVPAIALLVLLAMYVGLARSAKRALQQVGQQTAATRAAVAGSTVATRDAAEDLASLRARLQSARRFTSEYDPELLVRDITQACEQAGLRKLTIHAGAPQSSGTVIELPLLVKFQGDFLNVASLLRKTDELPWLTRVKGVRLSGVRPGSGEVQVRLSLKAYAPQEGT